MTALQPVLKGPTLTLRPLVPEDFAALYTAASDPLIWEQHPEPTRWQRDVFQRFFDSALESKGAFIVEETATGTIIGSSRYYEWQPEKREIAIGYTFLARSHWGGVTNKEMKRLMLQHIFQWADGVWFHIGSSNWRSRKAMEKIGGQLSHFAPQELGGVMHEQGYIPFLPYVRIVRTALIPKDYPQEPTTVGEHLKKRRKEFGLYQSQVAELFGVQRFAILNWEAGRSKPQLKDTPALINFLGYDPEPPNPQTIGEHLYAKRRLLGMSYRQLDKHLGFNHDVLMYWEQGRTIRVKEHRKRIAAFIGLSEKELCGSKPAIFRGTIDMPIGKGWLPRH